MSRSNDNKAALLILSRRCLTLLLLVMLSLLVSGCKTRKDISEDFVPFETESEELKYIPIGCITYSPKYIVEEEMPLWSDAPGGEGAPGYMVGYAYSLEINDGLSITDNVISVAKERINESNPFSEYKLEAEILNKEQIISALGEDELIYPATTISEVVENLRYHTAMVDADNDGIKDIIVESTDGSFGYTQVVLYKGDENGEYIRTTDFDTVSEGSGFFSLDNTNYYYRIGVDYNTKDILYLTVFCFDNGKLSDVRCVKKRVLEYNGRIEPDISESEAGCILDEAAKNRILDKFLKNNEYTVFSLDEIWLSGSAEKRAEHGGFQSDLDNDGVVDEYVKGIIVTTSWTPRRVNYQFTRGSSEIVDKIVHTQDIVDTEGTCIAFKVRESEIGNVIEFVYEDVGRYHVYYVFADKGK